MRITRPNLLSWYQGSADPDALPAFSPDCRTGALVTYPGEDTQFYLNAITPDAIFTAIPGTSLLEYRAGGATITAGSLLNADLGGGVVFGTLTCPSVPYGLYRWRLFFGSIVLVSNLIEVMSEADARACSIHLSYRHSRTLHGIRWPWIDDDFRQMLRVRATHTQNQYPEEVSVYKESTTGKTRSYNSSQDKLLSFQTFYEDAATLEGLAVALSHDDVLLNNIPVIRKESLSIQPGKGNLSTGTFSVIDNSFATSLIP